MAGLFGPGPSTSAAAANNTQGDISHDIQLVSPPEDSISDICFSPQSDHLAVASWDKKVRIYEINNQGGSEGKALFEHEAPVLSVHWSKVRQSIAKSVRVLVLTFGPPPLTCFSFYRTVQKSSVAAPTRLLECSTSHLAKPNK
jgi:WD40 repeat protein